MTLHRMFDAAYPPGSAYPDSAAVAGYIGGNTPHVWSVAEWQRFADLVQFPIWTGAGRTDGTADGREAADIMHSFGWRPGAPSRRAVIIDMETEANAAYVDAFGAAVWAAGYETLIYESASVGGGNPPKEGHWIAAWNGQTDIPPGAIGHQYLPDVPWAGSQVDLSVIDDVMLAHGGEGPRH